MDIVGDLDKGQGLVWNPARIFLQYAAATGGRQKQQQNGMDSITLDTISDKVPVIVGAIVVPFPTYVKDDDGSIIAEGSDPRV